MPPTIKRVWVVYKTQIHIFLALPRLLHDSSYTSYFVPPSCPFLNPAWAIRISCFTHHSNHCWIILNRISLAWEINAIMSLFMHIMTSKSVTVRRIMLLSYTSNMPHRQEWLNGTMGINLGKLLPLPVLLVEHSFTYTVPVMPAHGHSPTTCNIRWSEHQHTTLRHSLDMADTALLSLCFLRAYYLPHTSDITQTTYIHHWKQLLLRYSATNTEARATTTPPSATTWLANC
jgi:hypothetical protein